MKSTIYLDKSPTEFLFELFDGVSDEMSARTSFVDEFTDDPVALRWATKIRDRGYDPSGFGAELFERAWNLYYSQVTRFYATGPRNRHEIGKVSVIDSDTGKTVKTWDIRSHEVDILLVSISCARRHARELNENPEGLIKKEARIIKARNLKSDAAFLLHRLINQCSPASSFYDRKPLTIPQIKEFLSNIRDNNNRYSTFKPYFWDLFDAILRRVDTLDGITGDRELDDLVISQIFWFFTDEWKEFLPTNKM